MKFFALPILLSIALPAQDPASLDLYRDQLNRISPNPVRDVSDPVDRSRDALRAPLHADPNLSLAELQSAQTALIRLNDRLNADADRAATQTTPSLAITPFRAPSPAPLSPPTRRISLSPNLPAKASVDGRVTATFGFYTEREPNPWWEVNATYERQASRWSPHEERSSDVSPIGGCRWRTESAWGAAPRNHHGAMQPPLSSPCLFVLQCLSPITGIADLGAQRTQPIRIIKCLDPSPDQPAPTK